MPLITAYSPQVTLTTAGVEILEVFDRGLNGIQGVPGPAGPTGPTGPIGVSTALQYVSAVNLSGHVAITLDTLGKAIVADCSVAKCANAVMGITEGASLLGANTVVFNAGSLEHAGWSFTPDMPVFLGLAGAITQVLPAQAEFTQVLGMAVTATRISIHIQSAIFR